MKSETFVLSMPVEAQLYRFTPAELQAIFAPELGGGFKVAPNTDDDPELPSIPVQMEKCWPVRKQSLPIRAAEMESLLRGTKLGPRIHRVKEPLKQTIGALVCNMRMNGRFPIAETACKVVEEWWRRNCKACYVPKHEVKSMVYGYWNSFSLSKAVRSLAGAVGRALLAGSPENLPKMRPGPLLTWKIFRELAQLQDGAEVPMTGLSLSLWINVDRRTADRYLERLRKLGLLTRMTIGTPGDDWKKVGAGQPSRYVWHAQAIDRAEWPEAVPVPLRKRSAPAATVEAVEAPQEPAQGVLAAGLGDGVEDGAALVAADPARGTEQVNLSPPGGERLAIGQTGEIPVPLLSVLVGQPRPLADVKVGRAAPIAEPVERQL